ncbi:MAG TPA: MFS transporter, partial [Armatimonadetes bacterium]|nr:MFS transporter [Armatimonadota bacterium]
LLLLSLASLAYLLCQNVAQLVGARVLHGLAAALVMPASLAYMGELSPKGKEAGHMGLFNAFFFGGLAAGPLLGGGLKDLWGMRSSFITMGVLAFFAFLVTSLALPHDRPWGGPRTMPHWRSLLRKRPLVGVLLIRFCFSVGIGITWTFLPLLATGRWGLSGSQIGLLISLNVLTAMLLQVPSGFLSDRLGKKGFVLVGGGIVALCLYLIPWSRSFRELLLLNLLFGISGGLSIPALMGILVEEGKDLGGMGTVMGVTVMVHSFGMFLGPIFGGLVVDQIGIDGAFQAGAALSLVGVLGFWGLYRRGQRG